MDKTKLKNVVEAALMCAGQPLEPNDILRLLDEEDRPSRKDLTDVIDELAADFEGRSVELKKVASGYRIQVRSEYSEWLGRLGGQRSPKYSRALLETLALVAYRQPVTRGEIESVRGVSVSSNIVRTLLERGWVRIVGHRDVPGRPAMLGTTKEFLDYFGLTSLDELPALSELKDFDSINVELEFDLPPEVEAEAGASDGDQDVQVRSDNDEALDDIMDSDEEPAPAEETDDAELIGDNEDRDDADEPVAETESDDAQADSDGDDAENKDDDRARAAER
jgi:segregation and condensation protein B